MVGPDAVVHAQVAHAGPDEAEPRRVDVRREVTVVPRERRVLRRSRGAPGLAREVRHAQEVVGVREQRERRVAARVAGQHVQVAHAGLAGQEVRDVVGLPGDRVDRLDVLGRLLQGPHAGVGLAGVAVRVDGRRRVGVHLHPRLRRTARRRERRHLPPERVQARLQLADLGIRARHVDAVAAGRAALAADEVVVLVSREREQRVAAVDPVPGQPGEELAERVVVRLELGHVAGLAGPERAPRLVVVMGVGDVRVRHRHAVLLHLGDVAQRHGRGHRVEAGEAGVAGAVGDRVAVEVEHRSVGADHRVGVGRAEQALEALVAARLVGQQVRPRMRAGGAAGGVRAAVHPDADEVGGRLVPRLLVRARRVVHPLLVLGRALAEHRRHVGVGVLEHDVGRGHAADVAAGARERHPRRGRVLAAGRQHVGGVVELAAERVGPVPEHAVEPGRRGRRAVRPGVVEAEGVADRDAHLVAVLAGELLQDVGAGVRDQPGVLVADHRAVAGDEVEQVGHLLQVARHVRIVASQVDVVEHDAHDVLDTVALAVQVAAGGPGARAGRVAGADAAGRDQQPGRRHSDQPHGRRQASLSHAVSPLFTGDDVASRLVSPR